MASEPLPFLLSGLGAYEQGENVLVEYSQSAAIG